jgi:TPR repeat protein
LDIKKEPLDIKSSEAEALFEQGYNFLVGPKEKRDRAQAITLLRELADGGHVGAQGLMGVASLEEDPIVAAAWFKKAQPELPKMAHAGLALAAWLLGCMHEKGCGVRQNWNVARKWYVTAAHTGHDLSAQQASDLALRMKDWTETFYWALISEHLGIPTTDSHAKTAESFLSPEKIESTRKRAAAWKPRE